MSKRLRNTGLGHWFLNWMALKVHSGAQGRGSNEVEKFCQYQRFEVINIQKKVFTGRSGEEIMVICRNLSPKKVNNFM